MRVEIPAPADVVLDAAGNVLAGRTVSVKLAGTATDVTHYSALTGGTSTTGGLVTLTDGSIGNGAGARRYVESGQALDITSLGTTRRVEPSSASLQSGVGQVPHQMSESDGSGNAAAIQAEIDAAVAAGRDGVTIKLRRHSSFGVEESITTPLGFSLDLDGGGSELIQDANVPVLDLGSTPRSVTTKPLTANAAAGDLFVHISDADAADIVVGEYFDLRSSLTFGANAPMNEVVRVESLDSSGADTIVNFYGPIEDYYNTANTARLIRMDFGGEATIRNLTIRNSTPNARPSAVNEIHTIALTGTPLGGTWTLTYPANSLGISTSPSGGIPPLATEDEFEAALDPVLGVDNYKVDITSYSYVITYNGEGTLGMTNIPTPTVTTAALTGGTPGSTFTTTQTGGPAPENVDAIRATGLERLHVERCKFIGIDQVGVDIVDCLRSEVCYSHFENFSDALAQSRSGYGVRPVGSSRDGKVHHNTSRKGRHFFTTSGAVRHFDVTDNRFTEHTNVPCDTHAGAKHIRFARNVHDRCKGGSYQLRAADCIIEDFEIIGNGSTGPQIYCWAKVSGITYPEYSHASVVRRGKITGCAGNLVKIVNADDTIVEDVVVRRHRGGASTVFFSGTSQSDRVIFRRIDCECTAGDTGVIVYHEYGDANVAEDIRGKNSAACVKISSVVTNLKILGRIRGDNVTNLLGSVVPVSFAGAPELAGTGSPEGVVRGFNGTRWADISSGTLYAKTGGHSLTGWTALTTPPDVDILEQSSNVSTIPERRGLATTTLTAGEALGVAAACRATGTYTKIRFHIGTTFTAVTDLRLAVHDIAGVKLGETANLIGLGGITTPAASADMDNIPLLAGVALTLGDEVMLTIAYVGTALSAYAQSMGTGAISSKGAHRRTRRATFVTGAVPNLGTSTSSVLPWVELIP